MFNLKNNLDQDDKKYFKIMIPIMLSGLKYEDLYHLCVKYRIVREKIDETTHKYKVVSIEDVGNYECLKSFEAYMGERFALFAYKLDHTYGRWQIITLLIKEIEKDFKQLPILLKRMKNGNIKK